MAEIGDTVRYLNAVGGGRISKIDGKIAYVDEPDGFTTPVLLKECVVVARAADAPRPQPTSAPAAPKSVASAPAAAPKTAAIPDEEEVIKVEEVPGGDKLNIVLAFEPTDIKKLSTTTFDTFLVNDSNYYIYFSYLSKAKETEEWMLRYSGIDVPNIQLLVEELNRESLTEMDDIAFQAVAFKRDRSFALKPAINYTRRIDTTKFAKLHCFRPNDYFDTDVIAIDIVKNDVVTREHKPDSKELEKSLKSKKAIDSMRRRPVVKKSARQRKEGDKLVVDLHIHELVDNTRGLSNADMLNLQVDEFSRIMDENLHNKGKKIIFIHGKGEGVLRNAIMKELTHRYKGHDVQDASFREYGFGATQVTI